MARTEPADDLEALRYQASRLRAAAVKASRTYDRETWIRFSLVFFPVPFVLVLLRLQIEAWGYYVAGALFLASAAGLYAVDGAAAARRDRAVQAADDAQKAFDAALGPAESTSRSTVVAIPASPAAAAYPAPGRPCS